VTAIQEKVNAFADNLEQIFTTNWVADFSFTANTELVVSDFPKQQLTDWVGATNHSEIA
jgi:hypothetical protein